MSSTMKTFGQRRMTDKAAAVSSPAKPSWSIKTYAAIAGGLVVVLLIAAAGSGSDVASLPEDFDRGLISEPIRLQNPPEPNGVYMVLSVIDEGNGIVRTVNSQMLPSVGPWYTVMRTDCDHGRRMVLGGGETLDGLQTYSDKSWDRLVTGSSAAMVGNIACQVAGYR